MGDGRFRGQGGGGKGRIDRGPLGDARLDSPLPWDVVDTGISRSWLKADLQRALEAVTVPDCSHTVCSECGVCGDEFGDNIVAEPPPVPAFDGAFAPTTTKAQRLRLRFTKRCVLQAPLRRLRPSLGGSSAGHASVSLPHLNLPVAPPLLFHISSCACVLPSGSFFSRSPAPQIRSQI